MMEIPLPRKSIKRDDRSDIPIKQILVLCLVISALVWGGCAKVGSPTGGPLDTTPPIMLRSDPPNRSTQFTSSEIEIEFDEFIQLRGLNEELLVSPPLKNRPVIRVRNKLLLIDLNNELIPNTTYTMNFGNSIIDNNQNNPLSDFEFVFSTGSYIDSLAAIGKATSALDHKPPNEDEDVYIMLYENLGDSVPLKELPRYIGKVNEDGLFSVRNIHPDTFRIMALKDVNGDLRYNPITDAIAFTDTFVVISPVTTEEVHLIKDTATVNDTLTDQGEILQAVNLTMYYFHEENSKVFLNDKSRESPEKLFFTFTRTPYDTVQIVPLNFAPRNKWFIDEYSAFMDTVIYWITDSAISKLETISLEVSYTTTDLSEQFIKQRDTVQLVYRRQEETANVGRRQTIVRTETRAQNLMLVTNVTGRKNIRPNSMIRFTASRPLADIDQGLFEFKIISDSLELDHSFIIARDSSSPRRFNISTAWEGEIQYKLLLLPGAVTDIYGLENDSLLLQFNIIPDEYYGNIHVTFEGIYYPYIIQVLDEKVQVVRKKRMDQPGTITFDYMDPGRYTLRAIYDRNANNKWDTGNYLKHIQPEPIFIYNKPIETRSNWDYEIIWQITN